MNKFKLVYVAGPFRAPTHYQLQQNIRAAEALALDVWKLEGAIAICPHKNTEFFTGELPDKKFLDGDLEILRRCDAMIVATGSSGRWSRSEGTVNEVWFASANNIPVFYNLDDLKKFLEV